MKDTEAGLHYRGVNLFAYSQIQTLVVSRMVVDGRGRHLNEDFANQRVELKYPFPHLAGKLAESLGVRVHKDLTRFQSVRLWNSYSHIGKDFGLAGKNDIFACFVRCE